MTTNRQRKGQRKYGGLQHKVMEQLAKGNHTPTTISKQLYINRGNVHRVLSSLRLKKFANQESDTRHYYLTKSGSDFLLKKIGNENLDWSKSKTNTTTARQQGVGKGIFHLRSHNTCIKLHITHKPKGWRDRRREILIHEQIDYKTGSLENENDVYYWQLDDITIKTCYHSIYVYLPESYHNGVHTDWSISCKIIKHVMDKLEQLYNVRFDLNIEIISRHIADEKHVLRNILDDDQGYFTYYDEIDGIPRFRLDKSKGFIEWEMVHRTLSDDDLTLLGSHFQDIADHTESLKPSEVSVKLESHDGEFRDMKDAFSENVKAIQAVTEHQVSHIGLVQDIRSKIMDDRHIISEQREINKHILDLFKELKKK